MFQTHAGYTYDFMPALNAAGLQTIVHDGTRSDGGYSSVSNGKKHNFIWRANATAGLPSGFSLNLNCGLKVFHGNIHRLYSTTDNLRLDNSYTEKQCFTEYQSEDHKRIRNGSFIEPWLHIQFQAQQREICRSRPVRLQPQLSQVVIGLRLFQTNGRYMPARDWNMKTIWSAVCGTPTASPSPDPHDFFPDSKNRIMLQARYGTFNPAPQFQQQHDTQDKRIHVCHGQSGD